MHARGFGCYNLGVFLGRPLRFLSFSSRALLRRGNEKSSLCASALLERLLLGFQGARRDTPLVSQASPPPSRVTLRLAVGARLDGRTGLARMSVLVCLRSIQSVWGNTSTTKTTDETVAVTVLLFFIAQSSTPIFWRTQCVEKEIHTWPHCVPVVCPVAHRGRAGDLAAW